MLCNGAADDLFRQGSVGGSSTIQLAADYTVQAKGTGTTSLQELLQFKLQQESLNPQDDWEQETALNVHDGPYGNIRGHPIPRGGGKAKKCWYPVIITPSGIC